jgi:hypothetical protein
MKLKNQREACKPTRSAPSRGFLTNPDITAIIKTSIGSGTPAYACEGQRFFPYPPSAQARGDPARANGR